ncbi:hypothetical protein NDU88_005955 [Pleurodeles waltl]|uniref:Uncharacterized protein n=1 Tax=Pleurodeles waltl TaxID=8319 RepID=A0AAV7WWR7_PLEWA|nr:hypothetical protein NDU88_005955 [Pleurodeles waltl]
MKERVSSFLNSVVHLEAPPCWTARMKGALTGGPVPAVLPFSARDTPGIRVPLGVLYFPKAELLRFAKETGICHPIGEISAGA